MTGRLLLLVAAAAALCHVAAASIGMAASMGGSLMRQCKQEEDCDISNEYFQRLLGLDRTVLDEEWSPETTKAWNWIWCLYKQTGMLDDDDNIDEDSLGMYMGVIWNDKEEKKAALEQINACAAEAKGGQNKAEKMRNFYKCAVKKLENKELTLPAGAESMKEQMKAGKDCAGQHKITVEDVSDLCLWKVPLNPVQAGFAACMVVATRADGDRVCSCYIRRGIETVQDSTRRAHYQEKYEGCKDSFPNYQENYDKVNEFDKFKEYVTHMYDCLVQNVEDITLDDFFQLH